MQCEYCKNTFYNKTTLNNHQKTAKYCLLLRDSSDENIQLNCEGCKKNFTRKFDLERHRKTCRINERIYILEQEVDNLEKKLNKTNIEMNEKEKQLNEAKQHIRELEQRLENIATAAVSRPTTTKNTQINYIQNLQAVTQEHLADQAQHLTLNHIKRGPEGYAQFALEYSLKDRVVCVDYARRKIKFKDKDNNVITDPEMSNLASKFFESIMERNNELILQNQMELWEHCRETNFDPEDANKMIEYMLGVKNGSKGEKTEFSNDFVKVICNKTVKD